MYRECNQDRRRNIMTTDLQIRESVFNSYGQENVVNLIRITNFNIISWCVNK